MLTTLVHQKIIITEEHMNTSNYYNSEKNFMNYMHSEFKSLGTGFLCLIGGAVGMFLSIWLLEGIFSGYRGRISIMIFILPIIMFFVILYGIYKILIFPSGLKKKARHSKMLQTAEGSRILADFNVSVGYFADEIRLGNAYLYIKSDDFYPLYNIEAFKIVKGKKDMTILFKCKNDREKTLKTFDGTTWLLNKDNVIVFFNRIEAEHPEIAIHIQ